MTAPFDTATPLGEFIRTLLGSLGALERATIIERTQLGRLRAAREGRWLGGKPPYGYRVVDRRLVVEPAETAAVQRIFQLYVREDMGLIPIAEPLNAEGVPSPFGQRGQTTRRWPNAERRWNSGTLSRILRNTASVSRY
jgi:site-specific DNA recombinase